MSSAALLVSADLMMSSQFQAAAARQRATATTALTPDAALDKATQLKPRLVILDLAMIQLNPAEVVPQLRALPAPPDQIVAFAPHVHEARLAAALAAGCDQVMSRGQFSRQLDELLASKGD
jgi:DNA-binding NarL/FixJ family response regulator